MAKPEQSLTGNRARELGGRPAPFGNVALSDLRPEFVHPCCTTGARRAGFGYEDTQHFDCATWVHKPENARRSSSAENREGTNNLLRLMSRDVTNQGSKQNAPKLFRVMGRLV